VFVVSLFANLLYDLRAEDYPSDPSPGLHLGPRAEQLMDCAERLGPNRRNASISQ
jgi:hypothetical protein